MTEKYLANPPQLEAPAELEGERIRKYPFLPPNPDIGWVPYVWLIYVFWFAVIPFIDHSPAWLTWLTIAEAAISIPLYFKGYWLKGSERLWIVGVFFLLATAVAKWNAAGSVFIIYGTAFIGHGCDTRAAIKWLAFLLSATALESWIFGFPATYWVPSTIFGALVGAVTLNQAQRNRINRRLKIAQQEVERMAKIAERERIARDLHDLLGHTLSLIVLKSELASKLTDTDPERAAREIRDVERISRDALAQVRAAVRGYRSTGLMAEVDHARATLETAGVRFECEMEKISVPPAEESVLVLALREAVTNIVRHAAAQSCRVRFLRTTAGYELQVADDGRGGLAQEGSGLTGMRERVEELGGSLRRDASAGTTLTIRIPVSAVGVSGVA
jgi:two-component system sensor histidine kinase DesK